MSLTVIVQLMESRVLLPVEKFFHPYTTSHQNSKYTWYKQGHFGAV